MNVVIEREIVTELVYIVAWIVFESLQAERQIL